jgi:hypothetical protein
MRRASERKGDLGARTAKAAGVDEKEGGKAIGYGDRRGVRARLRYRDGREPKTKKAAKNERADQSPSTAAYILTRPCNGEVRKRKTHVSPRSEGGGKSGERGESAHVDVLHRRQVAQCDGEFPTGLVSKRLERGDALGRVEEARSSRVRQAAFDLLKHGLTEAVGVLMEGEGEEVDEAVRGR